MAEASKMILVPVGALPQISSVQHSTQSSARYQARCTFNWGRLYPLVILLNCSTVACAQKHNASKMSCTTAAWGTVCSVLGSCQVACHVSNCPVLAHRCTPALASCVQVYLSNHCNFQILGSQAGMPAKQGHTETGACDAASRATQPSRDKPKPGLYHTCTLCAGDGDSEHLGGGVGQAPRVELSNGLFEIGRQEPADIVIPVPSVSGRHAMLRVGAYANTLQLPYISCTRNRTGCNLPAGVLSRDRNRTCCNLSVRTEHSRLPA